MVFPWNNGSRGFTFLLIIFPKSSALEVCRSLKLNSETVKFFAKGGKLWVFRNFSDEHGFIVVDIPEK
jgi:hypothetical protein